MHAGRKVENGGEGERIATVLRTDHRSVGHRLRALRVTEKPEHGGEVTGRSDPRIRPVFDRVADDAPVLLLPGYSVHASLGFAEAAGVVCGPQHHEIREQPILDRTPTPHDRL